MIFIISFTVVFYYPFYFLFGTFYCLLIPIILTSFSLYFPLIYSHKKEFFNSNLIKRTIMIDSLVLSFSIMAIPTIIALELVRIGIYVDVILVILATIAILFGFLKFLDFNAKRIQIKISYIILLKFLQIIVWFSIASLIFLEFILLILIIPLSPITLLIISLSLLFFFVLNIYNLVQINDLKKILSENKEVMLEHLKVYTFFEYFRNFVFFGSIISISLLLTCLFQINYILFLLPPQLQIFGIIWYLGILFSFILVFLIISEYITKIEYSRYVRQCELALWLYIKFCVCFTLAIFAFPFSLINKICLFLLILTLLTPISFYFAEKAKIKIEKYEFFIKRLCTYTFFVALIIFYIEIFVFFTYNESIPFFYENPVILITLIAGCVFLLSNFCFLLSKDNLKKKKLKYIYYFYGIAGLLFFCLLYFNPILSLILLLIAYLLILYYRNTNSILRFISYFVLSFVTFIEILANLNTYAVLSAFRDIPIGFYIIIYLNSIIYVLIFSIFLNHFFHSKDNYNEKFLLFLILSVWSFVFILTYTNILIIYNITISLFVFLLFMGVNLYYLRDERYKWLIKPCILLFIFDFTSWISYSFLFINPEFLYINPILTLTLTATATGFGFVFLYNKSSENFRMKSFGIVLPSLIIFFPLFIYFFLISYFPVSIEPIIAIIIAVNFGIFLFYFSIGIYQWKLSWAIWKFGWWAWNLLPIVNFIIIYNAVSGINVLTNAINILGDIDILFITVILSLLMWLPALYQMVKDHFIQVLFIVWGSSLFLVYYVSLNLFIGDIPLTNTFFMIFSAISIMPLIYKMRWWKILSVLWLFLGAINILFFWFFIQSIGITNLGILISISFLICGLFFHAYSFFPNIRKHRFLILVCSYSMVLFGIFLTIYTIIFSIILNVFISINIAFIIIASTLYTSKYIKINRKYVNYLASWILIINTSLLTFNTFSLIPDLVLFAFFLAITVFGGSFFVFNHYKIIGPINKGIPWMIMGFGLASSISSLFLIFLQVSILLICAIYSSIFIIFLYFALDEYKLITIYLIPIPSAFLSLIPFYIIDLVLIVGILIWLIFYLIYFLIIFNLISYSFKEREIQEKPPTLKFYRNKDQTKLINFFCFFIGFSCFSLLISIISPVSLYYQIILFILTWSILMLLSLKYFNYSKLEIKYPKLAIYLNIISLILYLLIPLSITINISINLMNLKIELIFLIPLIIIIFSGILFIEIFIFDKFLLKLLVDSIKKWNVLISWGTFSNTTCFLIYLLYPNPYLFILNIVLSNVITNYFMKQIDIKRKEGYTKIRIILIYIALTTLAFYLASAISDTIVLFNSKLIGLPSTLLFFLLSFSLLFTLSYFFNRKIKVGLKNWVEFVLFLAVQIFFGVFYWIIVFVMLESMNIFTIFLIIFLETCLSYVSVKYFGLIFLREKISGFLSITFSLITFLLYLEVSLIFLGLFLDILGFYVSFLISMIILFLFTISDLCVIKKLNRTFGYFIHTISYFIISLLTFTILIQTFNLEWIAFCLFLFISMQFYTNYAFFRFLNNLNPDRDITYGKLEAKIKSLIGITFYIFLIIFIQSTITLLPWEFQLLLLSSVIHGLMIIDKLFLRFLGKISDKVKLGSWVIMMVSSSLYLYWIFNTFFYSVIITAIPLIVLTLVFEFFYLFKLMNFVQIVERNKVKIRKFLIFILYIDFITWPLYFIGLNLFLILNLVLLSATVLLILTYIDSYIKVFRERLRDVFNKTSFLSIGALLSVEIFIFLNFIVKSAFLMNLSIMCLILLCFFAFIIKPFSGHSKLAAGYWNLCFLFLSIIIYYVFLSLAISLFFFIITFILYWFIFALEKLRRFFSKFIDFIIIALGKIKQAISIVINQIVVFVKKYYKYLWIIVSLFIAFIFAYLVSPYLSIIHLIFSTLAIFGLSYSIIPSKKSEDPDQMFSQNMKRLMIVWGSVIGIIFIFIPLIFLTIMIFTSILILGAILLPYIYYKEKKEKISIKWRFYSTLFFVIILIITGILIYLQFIGILTIR